MTGARGIGGAIVRRLVTDGFVVHVASRTLDAAEQLAAVSGPACTPWQCDVTDEQQVERTVAGVVEASGGVDVLVNNAGIADDALLLTMSTAQWRAVLAANLDGPFLMSRAVVGHMLDAGGGSIVNVSSSSAQRADAGQTAYAASKGGLEAFTRALAAEVGHKGIRVNAVSPGRIRTDMTATIADRLGAEGGRWGEPDDIAGIVAFLAGPDARYVNGQVLTADGGLGVTRRPR